MSEAEGVRCLRPNRQQTEWRTMRLDGMLPQDHRARAVREFVEGMDLSPFDERIGSRRRGAGRPAADPAVLLALRLFATLEGVGSARRLAQLCERNAAFQRLCGGSPVNYRGLGDFRSGHGALPDGLLSARAGALPVSGAASPEEVAVDGTKVRASAGSGSFCGARGLARYEAAARERIAALKAELKSDPEAGSRRLRAARACGAGAWGEGYSGMAAA